MTTFSSYDPNSKCIDQSRSPVHGFLNKAVKRPISRIEEPFVYSSHSNGSTTLSLPPAMYAVLYAILYSVIFMSAVQQTFNTPDLLQCIIRQLVTHPNALISLSQVTQLTSGFAFDVLWRRIPMAFHILELLPSFASGVNGKYVCGCFQVKLHWLMDRVQGLVRDMLPHFLDSLQSHCKLIHHLEIHTKFRNDVALLWVVDFIIGLTALCLSSAQPFLKFCLSDKDMCILGAWWPRLRHLDLFTTCQYLPPYVPTFQSVIALVNASHSLQHLRISV
jgi:hypothetical protein